MTNEVRAWVDVDFPGVYELLLHPSAMCTEVLVPQEFLDRYQRVVAEFNAVQAAIEEFKSKGVFYVKRS